MHFTKLYTNLLVEKLIKKHLHLFYTIQTTQIQRFNYLSFVNNRLTIVNQ